MTARRRQATPGRFAVHVVILVALSIGSAWPIGWAVSALGWFPVRVYGHLLWGCFVVFIFGVYAARIGRACR